VNTINEHAIVLLLRENLLLFRCLVSSLSSAMSTKVLLLTNCRQYHLIKSRCEYLVTDLRDCPSNYALLIMLMIMMTVMLDFSLKANFLAKALALVLHFWPYVIVFDLYIYFLQFIDAMFCWKCDCHIINGPSLMLLILFSLLVCDISERISLKF